MADQLVINNGKMVITTAEGETLKAPVTRLETMIREESVPPLDNVLLPDGFKLHSWQPPYLGIVHQLPPHVRSLRWIDNDSPEPLGPGATYTQRRISLPYTITIAVFCLNGDHLALTQYNEMYFRNEPLRRRDDRVCFPCLLNVSYIETQDRIRAWICTQHLRCDHSLPWDEQLAALLEHSWNGAFSLSSEVHEGRSWYGASKGIHPDLHPIERWEQATEADKAFALTVPWVPVPMTIEELLDRIVAECHTSHRTPWRRSRRRAPKSGLVQRLLNYLGKPQSD